jgi:ribosomal protein S18 acetylase RimI-like enzyme
MSSASTDCSTIARASGIARLSVLRYSRNRVREPAHPPGAEADADKIVAALRENVSARQHADVFAVVEQMDQAHPSYPHWYLPWLAADPAQQGAGLGGQLLKRCLEIVDADRLPAFLETPNPRTISFYERHGFEVTSVAQAEACPPVTSMLREAR